MITQTLNLDMIPGAVKPVVHVSQYDEGLRTLQFYLFNNGAAANVPTDSVVTIEGLKPDGNVFCYECEYVGNLITADLTEQMSIVKGDVLTEIKITNGTDKIGSANFIIRVEISPYDAGTQSESEMSGIQAIVEAATEAAIESAAQSAEDAAESAEAAANSATTAGNNATSAANSATSASESAATAASLIGIVIPTFTVDFTTGDLMYTDYSTLDSNVTFAVNTTTGNLDYTITY